MMIPFKISLFKRSYTRTGQRFAGPRTPLHANHTFPCKRISTSTRATLQTETEKLVQELGLNSDDVNFLGEEGSEEATGRLREDLESKYAKASGLRKEIDMLYRNCFEGLQVKVPKGEGEGEEVKVFSDVDEEIFSRMGKENPPLLQALLVEKERIGPAGWQLFQSSAKASTNQTRKRDR